MVYQKIKTTVKYHYTAITMSKIQNTDFTKVKSSHSLLVGVQNGTATLENCLVVLIKLNIL